MVVTQWYMVSPYSIETQGVAVFYIVDLYTIIAGLASIYSTADLSTTTRRISILFPEDCWAQRQLPNCIRYIPVSLKLRKSLSLVEKIFIVTLVIFYSTADYSATAAQILMFFTEGCWARCQLPNCIRYISIALKLRKFVSSVEGKVGLKLATFYSIADYSTTTAQI